MKVAKEITFRQLYGFIKSQPQLVYNKDIPQSSCLCEICENALYVSKSLSRNGHILPSNPHDFVEQFSVIQAVDHVCLTTPVTHANLCC